MLPVSDFGVTQDKVINNGEVGPFALRMLNSRLPDCSRVAATYPPISPEGVVLTIRKFVRHFTTEELLQRGALSPKALTLILAAVHARRNILFAGGTSTGKTTMASSCARHIPAHERILTN